MSDDIWQNKVKQYSKGKQTLVDDKKNMKKQSLNCMPCNILRKNLYFFYIENVVYINV